MWQEQDISYYRGCQAGIWGEYLEYSLWSLEGVGGLNENKAKGSIRKRKCQKLWKKSIRGGGSNPK